MSPDPGLRALVEAALRRDSGAGVDAIDDALRYGRPTETRAGKAFFYQGDKAESAFLLLEGQARAVKYKANGKPLELPPRESGDWLGLGELVLGAPHPFDALAEGPCATLSFSRYGLGLASSRGPFASILSRALARELLALHSYIEDESPEERILSFLLSRRKELAGLGNSGVTVTQEGIARSIGATRETVNKRLKCLEASGLLRTLRGRIEVLDWEALASRRDEGE
jgi:CRP-like cAMP-binding protein